MDYERLKETYGDFRFPAVNIIVEGKSFGDCQRQLILSDIRVELSCKEEASQAVFSIYNCTDEETGSYCMEVLKPYILLGSLVVVEAGYGERLTEVFRGFIARVEFVNEENGPCVEVTAMDAKGIMMSNCCAGVLESKRYSDAVKEIFSKPPYQEMKSRSIIQKLEIQKTPDQKDGGGKGSGSIPIDRVYESDYEFVVKAARRFHYEFFVRKGTVYFREAKPRQPVQGSLSPGKGIYSYRIGYDIRGQVQKVEIRSMDDREGKLIFGRKKFKNRLSQGNKAGALISQTEKVYIRPAVCDARSAVNRAEGFIDQIADRYGSLECECVGIPELEPGRCLEITGLSEPADNVFYITEVQHLMDSAHGYRTRIRGTAGSLKDG